jgi:predicted anti-sigma-YlaC factor YlaD
MDDATAERIERHAAECEACGRHLEEASVLPGVAALPREVPPPEHLRRQVLAAVARRQVRRRMLRWGGAIAAGLALVLFGSLSGPPVKEAATRPPLGPPLPLRVVEAATGVREVRVAQAIGTLTIVAGEPGSDITWTGTRDDLTEVSVERTTGSLWLAVVPVGGGRWPAEAHATLSVPADCGVVVAGRGLLVRDMGGTAGITLTGRGVVRTFGAGGIEEWKDTVHR